MWPLMGLVVARTEDLHPCPYQPPARSPQPTLRVRDCGAETGRAVSIPPDLPGGVCPVPQRADRVMREPSQGRLSTETLPCALCLCPHCSLVQRALVSLQSPLSSDIPPGHHLREASLAHPRSHPCCSGLIWPWAHQPQSSAGLSSPAGQGLLEAEICSISPLPHPPPSRPSHTHSQSLSRFWHPGNRQWNVAVAPWLYGATQWCTA